MKKIYLITCLSLIVFSAKSQWVADTNVCNVICNLSGTQYEPRLCVDGNKGAIICWTDGRGAYFRIYAQHIDSAGYIHWAQNGILVSDTTINPSAENPEIVTDSAGGAIICYETINGGGDQIYAVRIDSAGNPVWSVPVPIDVAHDARVPSITSDENGGAIINWYAYISGGGVQVLVQWIDKNGNVHLPVNGLQITNNSSPHYGSHLSYAGDSSAYVVYSDNDTLRMQRFDSTGNILWNTPVTLSNTFSYNENEYAIRAHENANHQAYVFWSDTRSAYPGLYGQRINQAGTQLWTAGGNIIDTAVTTINYITLATDGASGDYVAYGSNPVRVQRISSSGGSLFTPAVQMCSGGGQGETQAFVRADGNTGAIVAWQDGRGNYGVYAQHVDSSGNMLWRGCGAPVYTADNAGTNNDMHAISCSNGTGIAAFLYNQHDVYCAKIENYISNVGIGELTDADVINVYPNPSSGSINIYLSNHESISSHIMFTDLTGRNLYKVVLTQQSTTLNPNLPAGLYFITLTGSKGSVTKKIVIE